MRPPPAPAVIGKKPTLKVDDDDLVSMQKAPVARSLHQRFVVNEFIGRPRRAAGRGPRTSPSGEMASRAASTSAATRPACSRNVAPASVTPHASRCSH
jgi:hypothetical protein